MTDRYTHITLDNVLDYPVGTRVLFDYGPMCGEDEGTVTGWDMGPFGVRLTADTDDGKFKTINSFNNQNGIGVYVLEKAEAKCNSNSPWAR